MAECIFCKIASGEAPADVVLESDDTMFFRNIRPKTKIHVLGITKKHITSLDAMEEGDRKVVGKLLDEVAPAARQAGIDPEQGYRVVTNIGPHAGQEVHHLHWHIMGGEPVGLL